MTKQHGYAGTNPRMTRAEHAQRGKNSDKYRPDRPELSIVKVPADSVPYGESISRNGRTVWAAYFNGELAGVGGSADDARRAYHKWLSDHARKRMDGTRKS
jgi:hypothetical protein